jgi:hypothetical protein
MADSKTITPVELSVVCASHLTVYPLSATPLLVLSLLVTPKASNAGSVKVGFTNPPILDGSITYPQSPGFPVPVYDLSKCYVQCTNDGDGVNVVAVASPY